MSVVTYTSFTGPGGAPRTFWLQCKYRPGAPIAYRWAVTTLKSAGFSRISFRLSTPQFAGKGEFGAGLGERNIQAMGLQNAST